MSFEEHFSSYLTEPSSNYFEPSACITTPASSGGSGGVGFPHDFDSAALLASNSVWQFDSPSELAPSLAAAAPSVNNKQFFGGKSNGAEARRSGHYTIAGRTQQNSRQFSKYYYKQVGTFLTQYKIRENYKFLQMISVPPLDPAVPKPEGGVSVPACGEPLVVPASFPQSIEAAIHKFANASSKSTCLSVVDQYGKISNSLTYG